MTSRGRRPVGVIGPLIPVTNCEVTPFCKSLSAIETRTFFAVEEDRIGREYPFAGEKRSVVMALYPWSDFNRAVEMVFEITAVSGPGHSCGIHTTSQERIMQLAESVRISRFMVNQPRCPANSGAWTNGMPMKLTLGCGTWGNNSTSDNINYEKLINTTWVSWPIPSTQPDDEDLEHRCP